MTTSSLYLMWLTWFISWLLSLLNVSPPNEPKWFTLLRINVPLIRNTIVLCLQWFVYKKSRARYSGHINSRLMRVWAQRDQTGHNSYYMRGKQKEHSSSACCKTCYGLFESLLVPLIIHIEVERTTCAIKFNVCVKYTSTMGWLASLGPSHRCTCLPGYTDLG